MKKLLLTTALVCSLAMTGGAFAEGYGRHTFMSDAVAKLPKEKAEAFLAIIKQERDKDLTAKRETAIQLHKQLDTILTAPTFDKAAYLAKSKELQDLWNAKHQHMTEAFTTAAATLSQEERKTLVATMKEMHQRHHDHHGNKEGRDDNAPPPPAHDGEERPE